MIGHNCKIGKHNLICAQAGIAGSCVTGDDCVLAGQVGIADHLQIGDRVTIAAQSGVMHNLQSGTYFGSPAIPIREQMQLLAVMRKLPEMLRSLRKLESLVAAQGKGVTGKDVIGKDVNGKGFVGPEKEAA
jgi:UDP-3-O-[3-hydroxymyristoyl] glucosamine N-acyltransferase